MNIRRDNTGIAYRAGAPLDEAVPASLFPGTRLLLLLSALLPVGA